MNDKELATSNGMKSSNYILGNIRANGYRLTKVRKAILDILIKGAPLSAIDIRKSLARHGLNPNKTTIYRELAFLMDQKMLQEVQFSDMKKRYEIMTESHHHHLICLMCEKVEDIAMEKDLDQVEKRITKDKNFKIINHSLEFYGFCKSCQ